MKLDCGFGWTSSIGLTNVSGFDMARKLQKWDKQTDRLSDIVRFREAGTSTNCVQQFGRYNQVSGYNIGLWNYLSVLKQPKSLKYVKTKKSTLYFAISPHWHQKSSSFFSQISENCTLYIKLWCHSHFFVCGTPILFNFCFMQGSDLYLSFPPFFKKIFFLVKGSFNLIFIFSE
jgi:hypothetical protein